MAYVVVCVALPALIHEGKRTSGICCGPFDSIEDAERECDVQNSAGFCDAGHVVLELYR